MLCTVLVHFKLRQEGKTETSCSIDTDHFLAVVITRSTPRKYAHLKIAPKFIGSYITTVITRANR